MKKKFLLLGALLFAFALILPACHTKKIGLSNENTLGCDIMVTWNVPGEGPFKFGGGPHQLIQTVPPITRAPLGNIGSGFPQPPYTLNWAATTNGVCCGDGAGSMDGFAPGANYNIPWICGAEEKIQSAGLEVSR
ncbi:MAG: hypothetical protein ACYTEL_25245 [Planctomycetota bacterium]|jgi:hypothetical protein